MRNCQQRLSSKVDRSKLNRFSIQNPVRCILTGFFGYASCISPASFLLERIEQGQSCFAGSSRIFSDMVIDAHIHMFRPDQMPDPADPEGYLDKQPTYLRLLFKPTKYNHSRQGWVTCEKMIEIMDREHIDRVCILGPEDDYTAKSFRKFPDRLMPYRYMQIGKMKENRKAELHEMRRYIEEEGFFGFGEHHPDLADHELYSSEVIAICELAVELDVPINLHVSEACGHFYYGKSHNPLEEYLWLAKRFPTLKIVLAHWGGGLPFFETIPAIRDTLKNVYYDTAASRLFFDPRKSMEQITKVIDPRKIFYGSDFPLLLHPEEYPDELNPHFVTDRSDFFQANIDPKLMNGIMGPNFARFSGILEDDESAFYATKGTETLHDAFPTGEVGPNDSTLMTALRFPCVGEVLAKYGLPNTDYRVPPWLGLIQPAAQRDIWYANGFATAVRECLDPDDPLRELSDLDLMHEKIRELAKNNPKLKDLFERQGIPCVDKVIAPWETLEQSAARAGHFPCDDFLADINGAIRAAG